MENSQGLSECSERNPWQTVAHEIGALKGRQEWANRNPPFGAYPGVPGATAVAPSSLERVNPGLRSFHSLNPGLFSCHAFGVRYHWDLRNARRHRLSCQRL
jgi:hypothetical protein